MKIHPLIYTLFWQLKKSLKSLHFHPTFFFLSQLVWPLILVGTFYFSYSPLFGKGEWFSGDLFSYLVPGIIVIYLYMEYVGQGFGLAMDRDYGVLEPIFLTPVNRLLWLFGNTLSAVPSAVLATVGFLLSSKLIFRISLPHPLLLGMAILYVILTSIPWGALVCAIFLSGRNTRFLYAFFETPAEFLSGSRFPLTALPAGLSLVALFYPLSHGISLLRFFLKETLLWKEIGLEALWLVGLGLVYSILAVILFSWAEERGKRNGTLTFT